VIQSRFFHSSLQEINLNVEEIYSLQGKLKESIVNKTKKTARFDKEEPKNNEQFPTLKPTTFTVAKESSILVSIPTQIEIATNTVANEGRSNYQGVINKPQTRLDTLSTPTSGSGFQTAKNTISIHIEKSHEQPKNTKLQISTLPFWVVFLIWEIATLLILIFFIL
jgi:hypothetical protein